MINLKSVLTGPFNLAGEKTTVYYKDLEGNYSQATIAIRRMKNKVESDGIKAVSGLGWSVAGLWDNETRKFFTFEMLTDSTLNIMGKDYHVVSSTLSEVGGGNLYTLE
ncbi:hypothetical protein SAMN02745119_00587 [Trichlorobacter thiogenes]|uniref:Uncharacterized protein n=1 Tax=Trichlorobacter thiogenes TaxID=115783 RepID=A0A1T4KJ82_9BACT|nr:hypothetical protein [Trichlorobacter thiogenes]SJZ42468.1 hypothetical protein SAMN02745119_00587 [Trichlorobacter thiogenes]